MKKLYSLFLVTFLAVTANASTLCIPNFSSAAYACGTYHMNITLFGVTGSTGSIYDTNACTGTGGGYMNLMSMSCTLTAGNVYVATLGTG